MNSACLRLEELNSYGCVHCVAEAHLICCVTSEPLLPFGLVGGSKTHHASDYTALFCPPYVSPIDGRIGVCPPPEPPSGRREAREGDQQN